MNSRDETATISILRLKWRTPTFSFNKEVVGNLVKKGVVASATTARGTKI